MLSASVRLALEKEKVLALRAGGASLDDIAYQYDTHPSTISKMLRKWNGKQDKPATKQRMQVNGGSATVRIRTFRADIKEAARLHEAGWTQTEIAERWNVNQWTVGKALGEYKAKKQLAEAGTLVPGKKYGDLIFERVIHGKAKMLQFRHCRGRWVETFTEWQWRERTA